MDRNGNSPAGVQNRPASAAVKSPQETAGSLGVLDKPRWYHHLTGGRPMQHVRLAFLAVSATDGERLEISGRFVHGLTGVHEWRDAFGRYWLAKGRWSLLRMRIASPTVSDGLTTYTTEVIETFTGSMPRL